MHNVFVVKNWDIISTNILADKLYEVKGYDETQTKKIVGTDGIAYEINICNVYIEEVVTCESMGDEYELSEDNAVENTFIGTKKCDENTQSGTNNVNEVVNE
jgi:hypothetical protein